MNYIRRNIRSQISVAQLANSMRLDPSQVYRIFRKHTGRSPQQVIAELRMEKACEFLEKTDLSIRDIAECWAMSTSLILPNSSKRTGK